VKDLDILLRKLRRDGYTITRGRRSQHLKIRDKSGRQVAVSGSTPSDWRSLRNLKGQLRRAEAGR
jgi:hypothetical protein